MPENKIVKTLNALELTINWICENQSKLLEVIQYVEVMAEDTKFTSDELKKLALLVSKTFGVTLTFPDALALATALSAGNLRLVKEILAP